MVNGGGEDVELAMKVKGIDLIIGGHSHSKLDQPIIINGIPIVQTGEFGQNVGCLSLTYSERKIRVDNYQLIPVDDKILGDKEINELIEGEKARISSEILSPLGLKYDRPVAETDFVLEGNEVGDYLNSNLGPLVADAIHSYVNNSKGKGTDISMVAAGVLFDKILRGFRLLPTFSG